VYFNGGDSQGVNSQIRLWGNHGTPSGTSDNSLYSNNNTTLTTDTPGKKSGIPVRCVAKAYLGWQV